MSHCWKKGKVQNKRITCTQNAENFMECKTVKQIHTNAGKYSLGMYKRLRIKYMLKRLTNHHLLDMQTFLHLLLMAVKKKNLVTPKTAVTILKFYHCDFTRQLCLQHASGKENSAPSGAVWATSWENLRLPYANNKGADQPVHPRNLISTFVFAAYIVWYVYLLYPKFQESN